eukprot:TRINITY_DN10134_c0_g2_i2.p1 TRINITY_DN10134_c0_g2~~TRINITY_DN10134_c0_g2_i2.p1  ORF type:complete len:1209 (-),score=207.10 TRINITY_DN10134_c0_g2_i2:80-3205(-)
MKKSSLRWKQLKDVIVGNKALKQASSVDHSPRSFQRTIQNILGTVSVEKNESVRDKVGRVIKSFHGAGGDANKLASKEGEFAGMGRMLASMNSKSSNLMTFYTAIRSRPIESEMPDPNSPHLAITPMLATIPPRRRLDYLISVNLPVTMYSPDATAFKANLIFEGSMIADKPYIIPLEVTPKSAQLQFDDLSPIDFGNVPIGLSEAVTRKVTNHGDLDVTFKIRNDNVGLTVSPHEGVIAKKAGINIVFSFRPLSDKLQDKAVVFEALTSEKIAIPFSAAGGTPRMQLSTFDKFDFGRCLMGKDTLRHMRITNTGTAYLKILSVDIEKSDVFYRGNGWPLSGLVIQPQRFFDLPLVLNPNSESTLTGKLTIHTIEKTHTIELNGTGREASLLLSQKNIMFTDCLVGMSYFDNIDFSNTGEVTFPLSFHIDPPSVDLALSLSDIEIAPYTRVSLQITYKPTVATENQNVTIVVESPFIYEEIQVYLQAGKALLIVETNDLELGHVRPKDLIRRRFSVQNSGTVSLFFQLSQKASSILKIPLKEGKLEPEAKKTLEFTLTHPGFSGPIKEDILLKAKPIVGDIPCILAPDGSIVENLRITVTGQSDMPAFDPEQSWGLDFGCLAIGECVSRTWLLCNVGDLGTDFNISVASPVSAQPTSGHLDPHSQREITFTWTPFGSYELRSVAKVSTSLGTHDLHLTGKALHPEFIIVGEQYVNFGHCAMKITYRKTLVIRNTGIVKLMWAIPIVPKEFSFLSRRGTLLPGEEASVDILFTPATVGRYHSTFLVEAKGRFKELTLSGVGGRVSDQIFSPINLGDCPYEQVARRDVLVMNSGTVPLDVQLEIEPCQIVEFELTPSKLRILQGEQKVVHLFYKGIGEGHFDTTLHAVSYEKSYKTTVQGNISVINLSEACVNILGIELKPRGLLITQLPDPLSTDLCADYSQWSRQRGVYGWSQYQEGRARPDQDFLKGGISMRADDEVLPVSIRSVVAPIGMTYPDMLPTGLSLESLAIEISGPEEVVRHNRIQIFNPAFHCKIWPTFVYR